MSALTFLDAPQDKSAGHAALSSLARAPHCVHLTKLMAWRPETAHLGGVCVQPASVVMGLAGWEDAFEALHEGRPVALFDIEKIARMMLAPSTLALEVLAGASLLPCAPRRPFQPRQLLEHLITRRVLEAYALLGVATRASQLRELMTGALLARRGALSVRASTLTEALDEAGVDVGALREVARAEAESEPATAALLARASAPLRQIIARGDASNSLPPRPTGYDAASAMIVSARMRADAEGDA